MYKIFLKKSAEKFLSSLDKSRKEKILKALFVLETNPIPFKEFDLKKLKGERDTYRIRIGKIRIVYQIFFKNNKIVVHLIDYREKVY
jgi:mRNA interferase RelE/StbE